MSHCNPMLSGIRVHRVAVVEPKRNARSGRPSLARTRRELPSGEMTGLVSTFRGLIDRVLGSNVTTKTDI